MSGLTEDQMKSIAIAKMTSEHSFESIHEWIGVAIDTMRSSRMVGREVRRLHDLEVIQAELWALRQRLHAALALGEAPKRPSYSRLQARGQG